MVISTLRKCMGQESISHLYYYIYIRSKKSAKLFCFYPQNKIRNLILFAVISMALASISNTKPLHPFKPLQPLNLPNLSTQPPEPS
jgi:hypothetical protein